MENPGYALPLRDVVLASEHFVCCVETIAGIAEELPEVDPFHGSFS